MKTFRKLMSAQNFGTTRLEAFSDGVFAIVITLLVLELRVPEVHSSHELVEGLLELWPKFLSFVVSFIYVTIYWINHHQLFHMIKKSNRGLFWLNSLFLMCLTFIPFPTALIGSYPNERTSVIFYGWAMMATAVSFVAMKIYVFFGERLVDMKEAKPQRRYLVAGPLFYLAAILLAYVNIRFSIAIYLLIPILYFFAAGIEDGEKSTS
jgi:uncharacterized membrane protein